MNQLNTRALLTAAGIAGVLIGLLSGIPIISCVNCLLLGWVWGGAIFAVYLYRRNTNQLYVPTSHAVIVGAVAGVIGAIIAGILSIVLGGLTTAMQEAMITNLGETSDAIPSILMGTGIGIIGIFVNMILFAIFGALGGLIASGLIWKAPPAQVPPPPRYTPPPGGPTM